MEEVVEEIVEEIVEEVVEEVVKAAAEEENPDFNVGNRLVPLTEFTVSKIRHKKVQICNSYISKYSSICMDLARSFHSIVHTSFVQSYHSFC